MSTTNVKIWIWLCNGRIFKAIARPAEGTLTIYDEYDNILVKRTGLTPAHMKQIECFLSASGAKRVDEHREPFTYL
jgi:hypothetical protein